MLLADQRALFSWGWRSTGAKKSGTPPIRMPQWHSQGASRARPTVD